MRMARAFLYLVVGLLLGVNISLSYAETIPATSQPKFLDWNNQPAFYDAAAASNCLGYIQLNFTTYNYSSYTKVDPSLPANGATYCNGTHKTTGAASSWQITLGAAGSGYSCPTGQNWTLSGSTCTRPDCVAPATRQANGTCFAAPNCVGLQTWTEADPVCRCNAAAFNSQAHGEAWISGTGDLGASTGCADGCKFNTGFGLGGGGKWTAIRGSMTGETCGGTTAVPSKEPIPNHPPKCAASEGVLTSSSGTVACVPAGTPDARVPAVAVTKKVETFPDNTTKTTETATTTDPLTGVKTISVSVTSTGGQSGTAGTATSSESSGTGATGTGEGVQSGDGDCDPTSDFCGGPGTGGLYEGKGKTMESVMQSFKDGVSASPIGQAATSFLTVTTPGGSCPQWVASVAWFNWSLDLGQYFCTAEAINALNLFGVVLFAVVSFLAFKWAIL